MSNQPIHIMVVDDHSMVIEGMKAIIAQIPMLHLKSTASNAFEAIDLLRTNPVDVAFVDINLPDVNGIDLAAKIKKEFPQVHIIGLSTFKQRSYVAQMINSGASGYLLKSADKEEIEAAVIAVLGGNLYFSKEIANTTNEKNLTPELPTLTRREKEILQLLSHGLTSHEIATKLFLSNYTVDTHRKNLLTKFDVGNTALMIKQASEMGIL